MSLEAAIVAIRTAVVKNKPNKRPDPGPMALPEDGPALASRDRASYWRFISDLGDTRRGVGLRPDGIPEIEWCDVPAGEFLYGDDKRPRVLPAFRIAKYLVTHRQFQAFLDAPDGFQNTRWWRGLHADGFTQRRAGPGEQRYEYANHPRENVSWYDAMAFCRWLSDKLGRSVTLPTEEQWEKAARGTTGRVFPYGPRFDPAKCNAWESGIHETSAVGAYPAGASPCGALDMSGNVWEWTRTEYDSGRSEDVGASSRRVVRGGSWNYLEYAARADCRGYDVPTARGHNVGFRVAAP
jgi:formylglycine-generating enzyme required for sulfatase activity